MIDDNRIEELLRESWQPEPPDGMRERVLDRARPQLNRRRFWFPRIAIRRWQLGLAAAALLVVVICGQSDSARVSRLAALENGQVVNTNMLMAQRPLTLGQTRSEVERLLKDSAAESIVP